MNTELTIKLEEEKSTLTSQHKKQLDDYKFEMDSKCNSIDQLEAELKVINE